MLKDDTLIEERRPLVQEAIRRMPEVLQNERHFRIAKALNLSSTRSILPESEWTQWEEVSG